MGLIAVIGLMGCLFACVDCRFRFRWPRRQETFIQGEAAHEETIDVITWFDCVCDSVFVCYARLCECVLFIQVACFVV